MRKTRLGPTSGDKLKEENKKHKARLEKELDSKEKKGSFGFSKKIYKAMADKINQDAKKHRSKP